MTVMSDQYLEWLLHIFPEENHGIHAHIDINLLLGLPIRLTFILKLIVTNTTCEIELIMCVFFSSYFQTWFRSATGLCHASFAIRRQMQQKRRSH